MPPMLAALRGDDTSFEGNSYNSGLGASSSFVIFYFLFLFLFPFILFCGEPYVRE
jgi:hypothetical protein